MWILPLLFGAMLLLLGLVAVFLWLGAEIEEFFVAAIICFILLLLSGVGSFQSLNDYLECDNNAAQVQLQPSWQVSGGGCGVILPSGSRVLWSWLKVSVDDGVVKYVVEIPEEHPDE